MKYHAVDAAKPKRRTTMPMPIYDIDSPALKKHRAKARDGLSTLSRAAILAYAAAVEKAVLAKQRSQLRQGLEPAEPRPNCASGTCHTTGEAIHAAIREQQRNALLAYPAKVRRARTDVEWRDLYEKAMAEKRATMACQPARILVAYATWSQFLFLRHDTTGQRNHPRPGTRQ
jgi:hypothetical protein